MDLIAVANSVSVSPWGSGGQVRFPPGLSLGPTEIEYGDAIFQEAITTNGFCNLGELPADLTVPEPTLDADTSSAFADIQVRAKISMTLGKTLKNVVETDKRTDNYGLRDAIFCTSMFMLDTDAIRLNLTLPTRELQNSTRKIFSGDFSQKLQHAAQSVSGPFFREQQFNCVRRSPCDKALDTNLVAVGRLAYATAT